MATVRSMQDGAPREVHTESPGRVLRDLLADSISDDLPGLTVTRPTLEDVYLQIVGAVPTAATEVPR